MKFAQRVEVSRDQRKEAQWGQKGAGVLFQHNRVSGEESPQDRTGGDSR